MSICPECFGPPKSTCFNSRCPYRRRALDNALDCFTADDNAPDPLEEMAAGLCPECRNPLDGGDMGCVSGECRFYGRVGPGAAERVGTRPGKRLVATGNRDRFTAIDGGWFGRQAR